MSSEPRFVGVARPVPLPPPAPLPPPPAPPLPAVYPPPNAPPVLAAETTVPRGLATGRAVVPPPPVAAVASVMASEIPATRPPDESWVARHRRRLRRAILRRYELVAWVSAVLVVAAGVALFVAHRPSGPAELAGPSVDRAGASAPAGADRSAGPGAAPNAAGRTDQGPTSSDGTCAFDPCATPDYAGVPTRIRIAAIQVDSSLESLVLDAQHQLGTPKDFSKAGWWRDGVAPGDVGAAVIAGHVDNKQGPAVFFALSSLKAGDLIEVDRGGQVVKFRVTQTQQYPKNAFPTNRVYSPTPGPELRLITCGGVFDPTHNSYRDNIVIYALWIPA